MDTINILSSADANYLPIFGVMFHSLAGTRTIKNPIAVHLLCHIESLDKPMLARLERQASKYDDVSLHFIDTSHFTEMSSLHLIAPRICGIPVREPCYESLCAENLVAITVYSDDVNTLISSRCKNVLTYKELKAALARELWLSKQE